MKTQAIVTVPPYAPYISEVVQHPLVTGIRLNTVMPLKGTYEENLQRLKALAGDKQLWIDLKYRQLRIKTYGVPPFTEIELTQDINVKTPVTAYFSGGTEQATVLAVEGNRLIMQEGPKRVVGPGESINIPDKTLHVKGGFTPTDEQYITAAKKIGIHTYMLSFVEQMEDTQALKQLDPEADIIAKIESRKGMNYVKNEYNYEARLMAARGDLYIELPKPHHVIAALETIIEKDGKAIVASRIFPSLAHTLEPSCED
ncbi:MAG: pyruvate kinase, partial [Nanoarchaeota archaeon]|nr:pyruvate kinase [Nanoarchaeota archaeon]